jgi:hypothetical protein
LKGITKASRVWVGPEPGLKNFEDPISFAKKRAEEVIRQLGSFISNGSK